VIALPDLDPRSVAGDTAHADKSLLRLQPTMGRYLWLVFATVTKAPALASLEEMLVCMMNSPVLPHQMTRFSSTASNPWEPMTAFHTLNVEHHLLARAFDRQWPEQHARLALASDRLNPVSQNLVTASSADTSSVSLLPLALKLSPGPAADKTDLVTGREAPSCYTQQQAPDKCQPLDLHLIELAVECEDGASTRFASRLKQVLHM